MSSPPRQHDEWFDQGVSALGDRWVLRVLQEAQCGATRFNDFARRLGAARNVLAGRLVHLVAWGLLTKQEYKEDGLRCRYEYRLTDRGRAALSVLDEIQAWASIEKPTFQGADRQLTTIGLPQEPRGERATTR